MSFAGFNLFESLNPVYSGALLCNAVAGADRAADDGILQFTQEQPIESLDARRVNDYSKAHRAPPASCCAGVDSSAAAPAFDDNRSLPLVKRFRKNNVEKKINGEKQTAASNVRSLRHKNHRPSLNLGNGGAQTNVSQAQGSTDSEKSSLAHSSVESTTAPVVAAGKTRTKSDAEGALRDSVVAGESLVHHSIETLVSSSASSSSVAADVDKDDANFPQCHVEYVGNVFADLRRSEKSLSFVALTASNELRRRRCVDWMARMHDILNLRTDTFALGVSLLDRWISKALAQPPARTHLQPPSYAEKENDTENWNENKQALTNSAALVSASGNNFSSMSSSTPTPYSTSASLSSPQPPSFSLLASPTFNDKMETQDPRAREGVNPTLLIGLVHGAAALLLASQLEEMYAPQPANLVFNFRAAGGWVESDADRVGLENLLATSWSMAAALDFDLWSPHYMHFLRRFSKASNNDMDEHHRAKECCQKAMLHYSAVVQHYSPSLIAAASVYLVRQQSINKTTQNKSEMCGNLHARPRKPWSRTLKKYTGYSAANVFGVAGALRSCGAIK